MLIKIAGLAVGMAASLLMLMFIYQQNNFDTFHTNKDEIYHLIIENKREGLTDHLAVGTAAMGVSLYEEFPGITGFTRFSMHGEAYFQVDDQVKMLRDIQHADSSLFSMFSFELLRGNPETALKAPFTMVLTASGARQLFGDSDPIGRVLKMNGKHDYVVTGVMKDPPANSHLQFNGLISFSTLYHLDGYYMDWDGGWGYYTYLRMDKNTGPEHLKEKLPAFLEKHINYKYRNYGVELSMKFDKLTDVYLNSAAPQYLFVSGNKTNLFIFGVVAVFILLIACINFMNLSTARFATRSREVGVRKTFGANRTQLIFQFLGESVVISLIALVGAMLLTELFLTDLSDLFDTKISLSDFSVWIWVLFLIALALLVGVFSGSYPAFFLSSFRPDQVLKGNFLPRTKGSWFRNSLVTGQFLISAVLITSTIGVFRQLNFMGKKELGFDRENVMVLELKGERSQQSVEQLKSAIMQMPYVLSAAASTDIPVWGLTSNGYIPEGMETSVMLNVVDVDEDWLETMRIGLVEGRNFDGAMANDKENIIINQTLAEKMGWNDPIGRYLQRDGKRHVIGVVNDFHFSPLHHPIQPLVITTNPFRNFYYLSVRLNMNDYRRAIEDIETIWAELLPAEPFIYKFLDQMLVSTYEKEEKFGKGFTWFALLAIFLACLGLFALSSILTVQRKKEIGIRKTFGADAGIIVWHLGKDFLKLVLAGNILAVFASWFFLESWLGNFAYHAPQAWWPYAFTFFITITIAMLTVAWQSIRAARLNPVDAIRYE
jgi:putative ABC transport system permease protein